MFELNRRIADPFIDSLDFVLVLILCMISVLPELMSQCFNTSISSTDKFRACLILPSLSSLVMTLWGVVKLFNAIARTQKSFSAKIRTRSSRSFKSACDSAIIQPILIPKQLNQAFSVKMFVRIQKVEKSRSKTAKVEEQARQSLIQWCSISFW